MSEYIVELDSKHSIALRLAFFEEVRGGDFVREEIVRCKNCKMLVKRGRRLYCDLNAGGFPEVEPDGFCAWGERRGDAE